MNERETPVTADEIAGLDDDDLVGRVWLRLLGRFGFTDWMNAEVPSAPRAILATEDFEMEWGNGGLAQYVTNMGDDVELTLDFVVEGYALLGLDERAELAARVRDIVIAERELWERLPPLATSLDRFDTYRKATRVNGLDDEYAVTTSERAAFIRANASEFVG